MNALENGLGKLHISYDGNIIRQFEEYMEAVLTWNEKVNLTAITERDEFITKHFIDSLTCCGFQPFKEAKNIIDVGTGAGFPGLPLAIAFPDKEFVLLDSLKKRILILQEIIRMLGVKNVTAIHSRAEDLARDKAHRERYDLCVSRAVSRLSVLSEYCLPFVRIGGFFAPYKTSKIEDEINEAKGAIMKLGGVIRPMEASPIEEFETNHQIIFIEKIKPTIEKYPRKAGIPQKTPLK